MTASLARAALILLISPLLLGLINKTKALMAGRTGPPLLQAYADLTKLWRKEMVLSTTTTWVFLAGPALSLVSALVALFLLPIAKQPAAIAFPGDMIVFVYLFALARFFVAAAALDTGSSFEGMGASREVTFAALAEPALLFGLLALCNISGSLSLSGMLGSPSASAWQKASASLVLILLSWFIIALAENSRVPFDDPNTHLELTMIHEVMVLDHSGPALGMILYATALKLTVFASLIVAVAIPASTGVVALDLVIFMAGLVLVAILIGLIESSMARLRLVRTPQLLITATLLSGFGAVLMLR